MITYHTKHLHVFKMCGFLYKTVEFRSGPIVLRPLPLVVWNMMLKRSGICHPALLFSQWTVHCSQQPHLMVKSWTQNNTINSSVLTIYGFSTSDNGSYQCNASDNGSSDISQPLLLTGKYHRFSTSSTPLFSTAINGSNVFTII